MFQERWLNLMFYHHTGLFYSVTVFQILHCDIMKLKPVTFNKFFQFNSIIVHG